LRERADGLTPQEGQRDADATPRKRERLVAVVSGGIALATLAAVWLLPKVFHDESAARVVLVAVLVGLAAIGFAVLVALRVRTDADQREPQRVSTSYAFRAQGVTESRPITAAPTPGKTPLQLSRVDLRRAALAGVSFRGADLSFADLREADLRSADLSEADLRGADLRQANLRETKLTGATYDDRTAWPSDMALSGDAGPTGSETMR
jgi:hypothetical protein